MNLLVLSDSFWPDRTGGITKSVLPEVETLIDRGHKATVITRKLRSDLALHESRERYDLFRYPSPPEGSVFYHLYPFYSLKNVPTYVAKLHKNFKFTIAYVHNAYQAVGLSKCANPIPYVYVMHAPVPGEIKIELSHGKYGWKKPIAIAITPWIKKVEKQALAKAKAIIVRSSFMKTQMQQFYGTEPLSKTIQIPLGIDTKRFSFEADRKKIRRKLNLPEKRPILLTIRRLAARMGLENLITAMSKVKKKNPDILLLICGKGYLEKKLKRLIQELSLGDQVRMPGFVREEELPMYYQVADFFVLPTVELEGFGLSTIESLACGTPVIATPVGANSEVIGPIDNKLICENSSPGALAERIIWWLEQEIGSDLRQNCYRYCQTHFNLDKVVDQIEKVLIKKYK
jgi:glycosyltransferase involved in cell wall biosynthesis